MGILSTSEHLFAERIRGVSFANPFGHLRIELEREALGDAYVNFGTAKAFEPGEGPNPNMAPLLGRAEDLLMHLVDAARKPKSRPNSADESAAANLALFVLYHRYAERLADLAARAPKSGQLKVSWYPRFQADVEELLTLGSKRLRPEESAPRLLGLFFQMARAFVNIYANFVGRSPAAVALRASMWESIFTHDLGRYRRALLVDSDQARNLMADIPTLITGPSGTGKELVAQAVGRSGFTAFNEQMKCFELDPTALFLPIHLAALSESLIESELFGHRRGAFTGALEDRVSFLESCATYGAVFLDEIAEIDGTLQVKLLRVLQTREFMRIGDSEPRRFSGRLISATNRDLGREIDSGNFREDLFFRLNADRLETPGLRDLLMGSSTELEHLVGYVASKLLPCTKSEGEEAKRFGAELCDWIESTLSLDYAWPGNFRELEQCAKAVLIRGRYQPEPRASRLPDNDALAAELLLNKLSADELLTRYCAQVFGEVGTYEGAARKLGLDRRTVRARVVAAAKLK